MFRTIQHRTTRLASRLVASVVLALGALLVAASRAAAMVPQPDPVERPHTGTTAPVAAASSTGTALVAVAAVLALAVLVTLALRVRHVRLQHRRTAHAIG